MVRLPTENDYKIFFEKCGFKTVVMNIEYEQGNYSVEKAFDIRPSKWIYLLIMP
jgi:hypothetical protein